MAELNHDLAHKASNQAVVKQLRDRIAELERTLDKVNAIRNSIIGLQAFNWSEHCYPLVAALKEAGIEGEGYPSARENVGTLLERTNKAEAQVEALRAALEKALPIVRDYQSANPKFVHDGRMQDPCGAHALLEELEALADHPAKEEVE